MTLTFVLSHRVGTKKTPLNLHAVILSIFLRLRHAEPLITADILAIQAVRISNDLYGTDVISSFEMAKGLHRPVIGDAEVKSVPHEIVEAHVDIKARRKLNRILRSHSHEYGPFKICDMVQVYVKADNTKRGSWSSARIILSINYDASSVVVPGRAGRRMSAAFKDVRAVPADNPLSTLVQYAIDELDALIDKIVDVHESSHDKSPKHDRSLNDSTEVDRDVCYFSGEPAMRPNMGERVEAYWPLDDVYYASEKTAINEEGRCVILYDDNEQETFNMSNESWRHEKSSLNASAFEIVKTLDSNEQDLARAMMEQLGQKPFLWHHSQGFDQSAIVSAYDAEERDYTKNMKRVSRHEVPRDVNIVSSHVMYTIKVEDDDSLRSKARIVPHANEESDTENIHSDCCMCSPTGTRVVVTVAGLRKWRITKIDVESAFHQSGPADRKVYVRSPKESKLRNELWLLLVAGYGFINANFKWNFVSDISVFNIWLLFLN